MLNKYINLYYVLCILWLLIFKEVDRFCNFHNFVIIFLKCVHIILSFSKTSYFVFSSCDWSTIQKMLSKKLPKFLWLFDTSLIFGRKYITGNVWKVKHSHRNDEEKIYWNLLFYLGGFNFFFYWNIAVCMILWN